MSNFAKLKRESKSSLERMSKLFSNSSNSFNNEDESEYWKCELDKVGNGYAIIRFLPSPPQDGDDGMEFIKYFDHGFKGPTGFWYIQKSLTTIGLDDPVYKKNQELWNGTEEQKKFVQAKDTNTGIGGSKRRLHFVSNIYVIKDSKHPENEGKVFKFAYGKKIWEKIKQAMNPEFEDIEPIENPFDLWKGANFKLKVRKVDGYQNYDLSEFDKPGPLFDDDEKMEEIWNQEYSLKDIIAPNKFKSYEELEKMLNKVLGTFGTTNNTKTNTTTQQKSTKPQKQVVEEKVVEEDDDEIDFDALFNEDNDE